MCIRDRFVSTSVADSDNESDNSINHNYYEDFDKGVGVDLLKKEMLNAAKDLDFEKASKIKDYLDSIKKL